MTFCESGYWPLVIVVWEGKMQSGRWWPFGGFSRLARSAVATDEGTAGELRLGSRAAAAGSRLRSISRGRSLSSKSW